jgi:hypothetical protein
MDILLAIGIFLITSVVAYMGVRVTFRPVREEDARKYTVVFVILTVVAGLLIGWQAYLGHRSQGEVQSLLTRIQANTENPPKISVNVPPSQVIFQPQSANRGVRYLKGSNDAARKKRLEIRTKLGEFLQQSNIIKTLCLSPRLQDFNCQRQINDVLGKALLYIDKNLEPSYRARFETANGANLIYDNVSEEDSRSLSGLKYKADAIEIFIKELRD